jgi:osmotically inducible protein OsmC
VIKNTANIQWQGRGKEGAGRISTGTAALKDYPYGFGSRFQDDRKGTNPEELLGAAHAACLTMAFSFACDAHGLSTESIETKAQVSLSKDETGYFIDSIHLTLRAKVPGVDESQFQDIAAQAKQNCPISRALKGVPEITLKAELIN